MTTVYGVSLSVVVLVSLGGSALSVRCLKDDTVPDWYPVNVYYCNDTRKPICCDDGKQFKCCEKSSSVALRDQIITWSVVFGFIAFVLIVWLCFRKDTHILETDNVCYSCCSRFCGCCCRNESNKPTKSELTDQSEQSRSSTNLIVQWEEQMNSYYGNQILKWKHGDEKPRVGCKGTESAATNDNSLPMENDDDDDDELVYRPTQVYKHEAKGDEKLIDV